VTGASGRKEAPIACHPRFVILVKDSRVETGHAPRVSLESSAWSTHNCVGFGFADKDKDFLLG